MIQLKKGRPNLRFVPICSNSSNSVAFGVVHNHACASSSSSVGTRATLLWRYHQCVHAQVVKSGLLQSFHLSSDVLRCYLNSGHFDCARNLFDEIPSPDVRMWAVLIAAFANAKLFAVAMELFSEMLAQGVAANRFVLSSIFKCYAGVNEPMSGKVIHGWILRNGTVSDVVLNNSIIDFYVKVSDYNYAQRIFKRMDERDTVSWNIIIDGCLQSGDVNTSVEMFRKMPVRDTATWNTIISGQMRNGFEREALALLYQMAETGPKFNAVTFTVALVLAATLGFLETGRQIHGHLLRVGFESDPFVKGALIDMYCKCAKIDSALVLFEKICCSYDQFSGPEFLKHDEKDKTILWGSMIDGLILNGSSNGAFKLFQEMLQRGLVVSPVSLTSMASACGDSGMLEQGRQIHALVEKFGFVNDTILSSSMIDMYARCGSVEDALAVFQRATSRNIISWTSIITGCGSNGREQEAVCLFEMMLSENIVPNEISFLGVLSTCSHAGMVEEGCRYFNLMKQEYGMLPEIEHFTCMVDLFGRANQLERAKDFILENNIADVASVWRSLLSACRIHKNFEMGKLAADHLFQLEPLNDEPYVLLSNLCASTERWEHAANIRELMHSVGIRKRPGQSCVISE